MANVVAQMRARSRSLARSVALKVMNRFGLRLSRGEDLVTHDIRFDDLLGLVLFDLTSRTGDGIRFVQVGAFDGCSNDPLYHHIEAHGWRGVLIEPQRHAYQELCKNYHTHPQLILKNVAIADKPGERTLYSFDPEDPDLPTWLGQMASFNRRFLEKFLPSLPPHRRADFNALIVEHTVPCITVAQAVEELGVEGVELVQIDAEGYDWEIVRTIDLSGPMPYVVRYESRHLSEDDTAACLAHLSSHGFKIIPDGHDTIAYRRPTLPV